MHARRRKRPVFESLEARSIPAVFGVPWPDAGALTLSFVPDGTLVAGEKSDLAHALDRHLPSETWQAEILRAFQTWAALANLNFSVVEDNGKPLGEPGAIQGNPWFGDIRIAGHALTPEVLAIATPYDLTNTWAGDVIIDTSDPIGQAAAGVYDLYSIALHEAGHVLGLPPSADPHSAMYDYLAPGSVRPAPNAADIASLQALYGARTPDRYEGTHGNSSPATATPINYIYETKEINTPASLPWVVDADLTTLADVDMYRFTVRHDSNDFFVTLRTSGLSLMTPRVTVLDAAGHVVGSAASTNPTQGDLSVFVKDVQPGSVYYVRVEAAREDAFGIGAYRLAVGKESHKAAFPDEHSGYLDDDRHTNDQIATATALVSTVATATARPDHALKASITDPQDVDFYGVVAPAATEDGPVRLTVSTWALEPDKLDPLVTVYDASGRILDATALYNDNSTMTVQVASVTPGATYYVAVRATDPQSSYKEGDYFLGLNFHHGPLSGVEFASDVLDHNKTQDFRTLYVTESMLFWFELSATDHGSPAQTGLRMTLYDDEDTPVFTMTAREDQVGREDVVLRPGTYTVRVVAGTKDETPLPLVSYLLRHDNRSDPTGPKPVNPITKPVTQPGGPPRPDPYEWRKNPLPSYAKIASLTDHYSRAW